MMGTFDTEAEAKRFQGELVGGGYLKREVAEVPFQGSQVFDIPRGLARSETGNCDCGNDGSHGTHDPRQCIGLPVAYGQMFTMIGCPLHSKNDPKNRF
jgi:hypothetical protein